MSNEKTGLQSNQFVSTEVIVGHNCIVDIIIGTDLIECYRAYGKLSHETAVRKTNEVANADGSFPSEIASRKQVLHFKVDPIQVNSQLVGAAKQMVCLTVVSAKETIRFVH